MANNVLPPLKNAKTTNIVMSDFIRNNNNKTSFIKSSGIRNTLVFDTKTMYTYEDVIDLLSKLDNLWDNKITKSNNFTYFS